MTNKSGPHSEKSTSDNPLPQDPVNDNRAACYSDEPGSESGTPIELPITDVLDLHTVSPRDAEAVVEEYLHECYRLKLTAIRIIHGRGIGVQRAMVRKVLERTEFVVAFGDAPMEAGGWGATVVTLRNGV
jgi:dsDNA-specific endonuclease/ATPase MutS2